MPFVTVYTQTVKRRKTGRTETLGRTYSTKSLSPMHAQIRAQYPDAITYENPTRVITDFVPGVNLGTRPIVSGDHVVARAGEAAQ